MRLVMLAVWSFAAVGLLAGPSDARIGEQADVFARGPLINQLQLTFQGVQALVGAPGRVLHRYVSDDGLITVDLVVRGGMVEQQVLYLPMEERRGVQVSFFLQDTLGSIVGTQQGLIFFRAAVNNRSRTSYQWGGIAVRFTPMERGLLQVLASR